MKKIGSWDIKVKIDDNLFRVYNLIQRIRFFTGRYAKKFHTDRNKVLKNIHRDERCFIVGNGPSIKNQDLVKLKTETTFFVNMFYKHEHFADIQPTYYVIVDPKLQNRVWPLSMLDEIIKKCPQTTLFLNAKASQDKEISAYTNKANIFWLYVNQMLHMGYPGPIDITQGIAAGNVIKAALCAAIYMGFRDIYLLGIDLNGLFLDLTNEKSHFYGHDICANDMSTTEMNLWSTAQGFRGWRALAVLLKKTGCNVVNLTSGGLLDCFPRQNFDEVV